MNVALAQRISKLEKKVAAQARKGGLEGQTPYELSERELI